MKKLKAKQLKDYGITDSRTQQLSTAINELIESHSPEKIWQFTSQQLLTSEDHFDLHAHLYDAIYSDWNDNYGSPPAWLPSQYDLNNSHLAQLMQEQNIDDFQQLHRWSCQNFQQYWENCIQKLAINFTAPYTEICNLSEGVTTPHWLVDAKLNIADNCCNADDNKTAIIFQSEGGSINTISYGELNRLSNRIANGLTEQGFSKGAAIAINMPMTMESVAIYLGIVKAGCAVVAIADSFSPQEIQSRLDIANSQAIFTQDVIIRNNKQLPLYQRVIDANAVKAIVLPARDKLSMELRQGDIVWEDFLSDNESFTAVPCSADDTMNILFSSGTTAAPKAIPWTHSTPIKAAADAYYHQDIHQQDILAWPTNLGWMMGPWLLYAALLNKATIALYDGLPTSRQFGEFVQNAQVTMLGVVPSIVKSWQHSQCMRGLDWSHIKLFSSTGESSSPLDMLYLMSLANYKPVIEYCGGTEIGGAYISSTIVQNNAPSMFSTATLGLDLVLLNEQAQVSNKGEVALIPPSMGLSNTLLNKDHHKVYYDNMPALSSQQPLRRHGDEMIKFNNGYYRSLGRADDCMNLGAIKISAAEIERCLNTIDEIDEIAAIAHTPQGGGPSLLIIFAVLSDKALDKTILQQTMQQQIRKTLNPLFKIHELMIIDKLPRTASNKVMRRELRDSYAITKRAIS